MFKDINPINVCTTVFKHCQLSYSIFFVYYIIMIIICKNYSYYQGRGERNPGPRIITLGVPLLMSTLVVMVDNNYKTNLLQFFPLCSSNSYF